MRLVAFLPALVAVVGAPGPCVPPPWPGQTQDILVQRTAYGQPCEDAKGREEDDPCSGVHAATVETVSFDNGTHGDVYVVAFWGADGRLRFSSFDTRNGPVDSGFTLYPVAPSVNQAGHTTSCTIAGTTYADGCAWIAGYRLVDSAPKPYLFVNMYGGAPFGVGH